MVAVNSRNVGIRRKPRAAQRRACCVARANGQNASLGGSKSVGSPFARPSYRSLADFAAASCRYHARGARGSRASAMTARAVRSDLLVVVIGPRDGVLGKLAIRQQLLQ